MKFLIAMGEGEIRSSFFTERVLKQLESMGDIVYNDTGRFALTKEELKEKIRDVDVLFSGWGTPAVDEEVLGCAAHLKIHAHTGGTVAPFISRAEYDRGILVLSGNDIYARSVAEGCLHYTLTALRRSDEYLDAVKNGGWRPKQDCNQGLIGRKIGIVGYGAIATYYVRLLKWFDADIRIYSKYIIESQLHESGGKRASLEEIFSDCDIISLHAALNDENRGMITKSMLESIKPGALFVNTARAGLLNSRELEEELKKNRFRAVLDVYEEEPLPAGSVLRTLPNVLLFPHIAGPTHDMRERVVMQLMEDIRNYGTGNRIKSEIPYDYAVRMTS